MATNNGNNGPFDLGRDMGDEQLREMEARLNRLYGQASEDITRRLDTFMRRWEAQDAGMRERLERGLITQDEYNNWVENKILRSVQMQAQIDSLAEDMVHVDQLAVQMINGEIPNVYCTAYNFTGYSGEIQAQMAGYNYRSFATYNANAVRIIVAEDPDLIPWQEPSVDIPKDLRWNRQHIQGAIAQGILAGDDINQLSRRLLPVVNMDANAARRTARTSYIGIQNQARRDAVARINEAGIPMTETWVSVLQANTRDTHLMLHGTHPNAEGLFGEGILRHLLRFPGDPNGDPEQIYNCQCGVKAHITGIDHSDQDARYEAMMRRDHFDDWVGQRDGYTINGVQDYRLEETRTMLERKRRLDSGEIESREARAYRRRQERAQQATAQAPAGAIDLSTITISQIDNMSRRDLESIAYEVAKSLASSQHISETEALIRAIDLMPSQSDAQLRRYIKKYRKGRR